VPVLKDAQIVSPVAQIPTKDKQHVPSVLPTLGNTEQVFLNVLNVNLEDSSIKVLREKHVTFQYLNLFHFHLP